MGNRKNDTEAGLTRTTITQDTKIYDANVVFMLGDDGEINIPEINDEVISKEATTISAILSRPSALKRFRQ